MVHFIGQKSSALFLFLWALFVPITNEIRKITMDFPMTPLKYRSSIRGYVVY